MKITFFPPLVLCLAHRSHFCFFYKMATCNRYLKSNKSEKLQIAFWIYLFRVFAWKVALQESKMAVQGKWKMTKVLLLLIYLIDALRLNNCISVILCFFLFLFFSFFELQCPHLNLAKYYWQWNRDPFCISLTSWFT